MKKLPYKSVSTRSQIIGNFLSIITSKFVLDTNSFYEEKDYDSCNN